MAFIVRFPVQNRNSLSDVTRSREAISDQIKHFHFLGCSQEAVASQTLCRKSMQVCKAFCLPDL